MKVKIPPAAVPYLETTNETLGEKELRDLPVALRIPYVDAAGNLAPDDGQNMTPQGAELGVLLAKWSALSLSERQTPT